MKAYLPLSTQGTELVSQFNAESIQLSLFVTHNRSQDRVWRQSTSLVFFYSRTSANCVHVKPHWKWLKLCVPGATERVAPKAVLPMYGATLRGRVGMHTSCMNIDQLWLNLPFFFGWFLWEGPSWNFAVQGHAKSRKGADEGWRWHGSTRADGPKVFANTCEVCMYHRKQPPELITFQCNLNPKKTAFIKTDIHVMQRGNRHPSASGEIQNYSHAIIRGNEVRFLRLFSGVLAQHLIAFPFSDWRYNSQPPAVWFTIDHIASSSQRINIQNTATKFNENNSQHAVAGTCDHFWTIHWWSFNWFFCDNCKLWLEFYGTWTDLWWHRC